MSNLQAQKVGPYDKKTEVSQAITAKIKLLAAGGNIQTHTQLYFVTPQRYALEYARDSLLSFLTPEQQTKYNLDPRVVDQASLAIKNPTEFSPLLKSEINKSLTGEQNKGDGTEFVGYQDVPVSSDSLTNPTQSASGPLSSSFQKVPIYNHFSIVGKLQDMSDNKSTQSLFWRLAGQVASLPTRMMALVTTPIGSVPNDYTIGCTGNYATEDWLSGNCKPSTTATVSAAPASTSNMCIETKIADQATLTKYANDLKNYLGLATNQAMWAAYFSGYAKGGQQYLFESADVCNFGSYNSVCFSNVIDYAVQNNLNPYLAIAIALNETGGLKSNLPLGVGPHFGCGVNTDKSSSQVIGNGTPASKLQCMVGAFNDYANAGKSANDALTTYGYVNGVHNHNLTTIINLLSNNTYTGVCQ